MKSWKPIFVAGTTLTLCTLISHVSRAEHIDVSLTAECAGVKVSAAADTTPPIGGVNRRPVLHINQGAQVKVVWSMKSGFPHGVMKRVTVHFFIVKEKSVGQLPTPDPAGSNGVVDNSFTMDFAPKAVASGSITTKLQDPGAYLVRIQSEDTHQDHDHEHFSAIDILVQ